jgi:glycosyltransferase involved in cell wall biosynthesis
MVMMAEEEAGASRSERSRLPLELVFLSGHDPLNVRAFSGTIFYMARALREVFPAIELVRSSRPFWFERFQWLIERTTGGRTTPLYWRPLNRLFARRLARRWRGRRVLVIGTVAAPLLGELADYVPVIHISDATFALMRNFYANVARYTRRTGIAAEEGERRTILGAVHNSFSSRWAAASAIEHYGAAREDVSAISWGCNLEDVPRQEARMAASGPSTCRLLFLGADWVRKGGDVVCSAAEILARRGIPIQVDVAGAAPPAGLGDKPWLRYHGFLSKADDAQFGRLLALLRDADFLFLPTRQDCTPMVFGEANAYGTPVVTRDVGGVADVVHDGSNGIILAEAAEPEDFADAIAAAWQERARYAQLREGARRAYEERLNWHSWARAMGDVVKRLEAEGRI